MATRVTKYKAGWACANCGTDFVRHDDLKYGSGSTCSEARFVPDGSNAAFITAQVARLHVCAPLKDVLAPFKKTLAMKTVHPAMKAGIVAYAVAKQAENRRFYRDVMRQEPVPNEALITRVLMGELTAAEVGL